MGIEEVQRYKDRWQATSDAILSVPPERVAAKDGFIAIYQTIALTRKMFHEYGHSFDIGFFRNLRESLGKNLLSLVEALQDQAIDATNGGVVDVSAAVARILTGEQKKELIDKSFQEINSEIRGIRTRFRKVIKELERDHRSRGASGTAVSAESPTNSPLTNFGGIIPGELEAALQGLLSKMEIEGSLKANLGTSNSDKEGLVTTTPQQGVAGKTPLPLGDIQNAVTTLLLALQSQIGKRSNTIALQQIQQALPNANLEDPKLGIFVDILALEGILGLNESGLIPDLLTTLLQNKLPQLTPDELKNVVQALSPLISQALLQLNTARVLSFFSGDLKGNYINLLQKIQQQTEGGLASNQVQGAAQPTVSTPKQQAVVAATGDASALHQQTDATADVSSLKQPTEAFVREKFPGLSDKQLNYLVDRLVGILFGPTLLSSKDAASFKETVGGASEATPASGEVSLQSSVDFQEFQRQLRFPKPLKELLTEDAHRQVAEAEGLRQAQLHQINKAFSEASQEVADRVAARDLRADLRKGLARDIDRSLSQEGDDLLADQLASKEQQRSDLADDFHNLNSRAGELAGKIYFLTVSANLDRVKDAGKKEVLRRELQAPLNASLALSLGNAGVSGAQSLAEQISQAVTGPDFAVSILKKLQQPPPAVATALAEAKAEAAVAHEVKKVAEVLPSVIESLIKLSNRDSENRRHDDILSYIREIGKKRSPRFRETNYLSAFLENQLDPAVKYERRGGIQPALMEYNSQIEKEIKANPGMV